MQTSAVFLIGFVLCTASAFGQTESEIRDQIVGTWKLVSTEETTKDGTTRPFPAFGPHAKGFLMYQRDGHMCAELMNPDRAKRADPLHPTAVKRAAAADGVFAYCGRYEIDAQQKRIVHLPDVATDPGYVGSRQVRPFSFEGGRLILGPPFWKRTKRWHPTKLKPQKGSKQRAVGVLKARTKKDGRSLSLHGFPCFVLAHNLFGPRVAAWLLDTCLLRPMPVKAEKISSSFPRPT